MNDVIYSRPPEKILHKWEQSSVEAEHIIKGLTVGENQIVLDPFMGSAEWGRAGW
jgi:DNA modification methylase